MPINPALGGRGWRSRSSRSALVTYGIWDFRPHDSLSQKEKKKCVVKSSLFSHLEQLSKLGSGASMETVRRARAVQAAEGTVPVQT